MERRQLVVCLAELLLVAPAARLLTGCGKEEEELPPFPEEGGYATLTFTSSLASSHAHKVTLDTRELSAPPEGGVQHETSEEAGHRHLLALTAEELRRIHSGGVVHAQTSNHGSHSHAFSFATW
ncbi:MAG: hypothetical protein HYZ28_24385 [Myxococcales bacterium]|nr:hypothetical protein [Myxococcales bacterium]